MKSVFLCWFFSLCVVHGVPFKQWAHGLVIRIPAFELGKIGPYFLNVTDGACSSFVIKQLSGQADAFGRGSLLDELSAAASADGVNMSIQFVGGFDCSVNTLARDPLVGLVPVTLNVRFSSGTSLDVGFIVMSDMNSTAPLPSSVAIPRATCHSRFQLLSAEANSARRALQGVLNSFIRRMGLSRLSNMLNTVLCKGFTDADTVKPLNRALAKWKHAVRDTTIFQKLDALVPPPPSPSTFSLHNLLVSSPVGHVFGALARELGHIDNLTQLNSQIAELFQRLGLDKELAGPFHMSLPGLNITAKHIIPSSDGISVLNGSIGDNVMSSMFGLAKVDMQVPIEVSFAAFNNTLLQSRSGSLDIPFSNIRFASDLLGLELGMLANFDNNIVRRHKLDQLQHSGCMCRCLGPNPWEAVNVHSRMLSKQLGSLALLGLTLTVSGLSILWDIGSVIKELRGVGIFMSQVVEAVEKTFGSSAYAAANGGGIRLLIEHVNDLLHNFSATCGPCPATNISVLGDSEQRVTTPAIGIGIVAFGFSCICILVFVWSSCCRRKTTSFVLPDDVWPDIAPRNAPGHNGSSHSDPKPLRQFSLAIQASIMGVIAVFMVAHTTWFFSVTFIFADSEAHTEAPLQRFTVSQTIALLWKATSPYLSITLALGSIVFPYVKMLLLLGLTVAPLSIFSPRKRELALVVLIQTGKLSLLDCSLFILMIVGLQVPWKHNADSALYLKIGAVEPLGYLAQIAAASLSISVGHCILVAHRFFHSEREHYVHNVSVITSRLCNSSAQPSEHPTRSMLPTRSKRSMQNSTGEDITAIDEVVGFNPRTRCCLAHVAGKQRCGLLTTLLCMSLICFSLGVFGVQVFEYSFDGGISVVRSVLGSPNSVPQTMWGIFNGIYLTEYRLQLAEVLVYTLLIIFCVLLPGLYLLLLIILWIYPLTARTQFHLWILLQLFQSWACLDIFVLALLVAQLGSGAIKEFISAAVDSSGLGPMCQKLEEAHVPCIDYIVEVKPFVLILVLAAVLCHVCGFYVYRLMIRMREGQHSAIQEEHQCPH